MKLYNQYFKVYYRNKLLLLLTVLIIGFCLYQVVSMYVKWPDMALTPLEVTLKQAKYAYIFFLIAGYMFFYSGRQVCAEECVAATSYGNRKQQYAAQFAVMVSIALIISLILVICNIVIFEIINNRYCDGGIGFDYICHIFKCIFVYIFLNGILAVCFGCLFHRIGNRIAGYGLILLVIFISSPYMEKITNTLMDTMNINLFAFKNCFDIFPINLRFAINYEFGFSVLPYKIAVIVFWIAFVTAGLVFVLKLKHRKLWSIAAAAVCVVSIVVYTAPASKVIMDFSPDGSAMHDMFYYTDNKNVKEKKADFKVTEYDMDISIGLLLKAEAELSVDRTELDKYEFTLYHSYDVDSVKNQNGENLTFKRSGDYLEVNRGDSATQKLVISYSGAAKAYYSNSQGIYLTGDFQYYPAAGYIRLADTTSGFLESHFLDYNAYFDVNIKYHKQIYSNLEEKSKNHFVGKANGVTLMAGMLSEKTDGINKIIYPSYADYDRKENDYTLELLKECDFEGATFVIIPNMNQGGSLCNVSRQQIISSTPLYSGDGFRQEWIDILTEQKERDGSV
mgnify:CR=1 FL=1